MRLTTAAASAAAFALASGSKLDGWKAPTHQETLDVLLKSRSGPRIAQVATAPAQEPQQLHLALTGELGAMQLTYVTMAQCAGTVQYGLAGGNSTTLITAQAHTYSAGVLGWSGSIHTATMTDLQPGQRYSYMAGCTTGGITAWSEPRQFEAAPAPSANAVSKVAVLADMGTIMPLGWAVADQVIEDYLEGGFPFDMSMIAGDLSYATLDPPHNEVEFTWDAWGLQNEIFTSTAPFMTTVGNHENTPGTLTNATGTYNIDFAAFQARYFMPPNGNGNFWYSYDYKNVHYIAACSECDYSVGSPQWNWIKADLEAANANRATVPWVIFSLHRPIYSADQDGYDAHQPGCPLSVAFEPLFKEAGGVDLVIQGHEHCYERTGAVYNGTVVTMPQGSGNVYTNPTAPVYIVQGTSGADQREVFVSPTPAWSLIRMNNVYGYGRMTVTGASRLDYQFVDIEGVIQDSWSIVKTGSSTA